MGSGDYILGGGWSWCVVVGLFWVVVGRGGFAWVVGLLWEVVGSDGLILSGGGWW